jgi:hypothetical protein
MGIVLVYLDFYYLANHTGWGAGTLPPCPCISAASIVYFAWSFFFIFFT